MELTVESRFTIRPLRSPFDSAAPSARNLTCSSSTSAIRAHVFMLPISSPIKYLSFFVKLAPGPLLSLLRGGGAARIRVQHHLLRILQIDGVDAAIAGLPLREIFDDHAVFAGEVAGAEVNSDCLRINGAGDAGHHRTQILRVGEVHFADAVGRAGAHEVDVLHELLVRLHALAAFFARHVFREAGDYWKLQIFAARAVENHAVGIDEGKFGAIAEESDGRALGQVHAKASGENALHGGGLNPGDFFQRAAPCVQRNTQNAAAAVVHKLLQHRFAADNVVAVNFNLIGLDEQHLLPIKQKAPGGPGSRHACDSYYTDKQNSTVE